MPEIDFTIDTATGELQMHVRGIAGPGERQSRTLRPPSDAPHREGPPAPPGLLGCQRRLEDRKRLTQTMTLSTAPSWILLLALMAYST